MRRVKPQKKKFVIDLPKKLPQIYGTDSYPEDQKNYDSNVPIRHGESYSISKENALRQFLNRRYNGIANKGLVFYRIFLERVEDYVMEESKYFVKRSDGSIECVEAEDPKTALLRTKPSEIDFARAVVDLGMLDDYVSQSKSALISSRLSFKEADQSSYDSGEFFRSLEENQTDYSEGPTSKFRREITEDAVATAWCNSRPMQEKGGVAHNWATVRENVSKLSDRELLGAYYSAKKIKIGSPQMKLRFMNARPYTLSDFK